MTRQLVVIGTAVMTTLLALVALWKFGIVVIYVVISLMLAATVRPMVRSETRRSFMTRVGVLLLYTVSIAVFGLLIFLVVKLLIGDLQELGQTIAAQNTWILPSWLEGSLVGQTLDRWLP